MKCLRFSLIMVLVVTFLFSQEISYAQTPELLHKNIEKEGITSPLPKTAEISPNDKDSPVRQSDTSSLTQLIQTPETSPVTPNAANYYPDQRLPENETKLLMTFGLLSMLAGTLLVSGMRMPRFTQTRARAMLTISKHFSKHI
jgi:hypothetical protein